MFPQPFLAPELDIWLGRAVQFHQSCSKKSQKVPVPGALLVYGIIWVLLGSFGKGHGGVVHINSSTASLEPSRGRKKEENQNQPMALPELRVTHTSGCHPHSGQPLGEAGAHRDVVRETETPGAFPQLPKSSPKHFPTGVSSLHRLPAQRAAPYLYFSPQPLLLPTLLCC